jgi:4-hydroxy-tetrahydrodipicolinate reductase
LTSENLKKLDVAIEFSNPENVLNNIKLSLTNHLPIVVGTTGWYKDYKEMTSYCEKNNGSMLTATNFSIGVNIFFEINRKLAELMGKQQDYSAEIQEIHHTEKLDSPSGTAITLAEDLLKNSKRYNSWKNEATEDPKDLEITSFRESGIPGTHEVNYDSDIDKISIKHEAKNRKGFALGAVLAAEFIHNKKGVFTMNDVLNQ